MVSTPSSYLRGISPPKYRRQTLEIFDIYGEHKSDNTHHLPARPASAWDRKWVHRSLGDLTSSDTEFINSHPRLQTDFYQDLIKKYPQAFAQRRIAREAGRKLFNSRPHVRFEDEEAPPTRKSRSVLNLNRNNDQLTNWDREVGPYIRNSSRECFTSVEPSECSGSVMSLKQRLHMNSMTLNKLLNENSPLRKKFERDKILDDSGTENDQTLEEYFLDKSRLRSRNRIKHRRVLQRRITNTNDNKEQEKHKNNLANRRWMSKSVSPVGRNMYSLPAERMTGHSSKNMDIDSVMRDSDLKIDTLLEKISSKLSSQESPPDSAIDVDTPSVQSFVSCEKVMTSDNMYHVSIDLSADEKAGDFESHSSMDSSPGMYSHNRSDRANYTSAIVNNSAIDTSNFELSHEGQSQIDIHEAQSDFFNNEYDGCYREMSAGGPGLLQLYTDQLMPQLSNGLNHLNKDFLANGTGVEVAVTSTDEPDNHQDESDNSEGARGGFSVDKTTPSLQDGGEESHGADVNEQGAIKQGTEQLDIGVDLDQHIESFPTRPPRGRKKKKEKQSSALQSDQPVQLERSDTDSSILDEVQLEGMSHDLNGRHPFSDNIDDTDARLGIPKIYSHEAKIAEKYRRTRSPSPFILRNRKTSLDRPKSAPLFGTENHEMKIVDIPLTNSDEDSASLNQPNTHIDACVVVCNTQPVTREHDASCQNNDIRRERQQDIYTNGQLHNDVKNEMGLKKKSCVQNCDSRILVSSSQVKQRNDTAIARSFVSMATDSPENGQNCDNNEHTVDIDESMTNDRSCNKVNSVDQNIPNEVFNSSSTERVKDLHLKSDDTINQSTQMISARKGFYKPSTTSPRTNEKRLKLKSLLKTKKGSYSPSPSDPAMNGGQLVNAMGQQQDITGHRANPINQQSIHIGQLRKNDSPMVDERLMNPAGVSNSVYNDNNSKLSPSNNQQCNFVQKSQQSGAPMIDKGFHDPGSVTNDNYSENRTDDSDTESDLQTVRSTTVLKNSQGQESLPSNGAGALPSSHESLPKNTNIPPAKPARTKHKKLPPDLNLSLYKITPKTDDNKLDPTESNTGFNQQGGKRSPVQEPQGPNDIIETTGPQKSNLEGSKAISASRGSLFGGFKSATKGTFKSLKKAMSLDKGIDKAGVISFPDPNNQPNSRGGDNSDLPKMKKAPSIKSIASLFGRKKKKKGKMNSDGIEVSSSNGSCHSLSSDQTGGSDIQQPGTSTRPNGNPGTSSTRPKGKLKSINPDGTQLIQLIKPQNGPIGFFIAKGSAKFKNGIFISRFADSKPEKTFGGLLSVGDEILEVNGHFVRDLSQDGVYDIISASPIVVLKVFPLIARKDI